MATTTATRGTDVLTDVVRERARAEAREVAAMLSYRDAEIARTEHVEPPMRRLVERSAIAMTIGQAMGLSEGQVHQRLAAAERVRQQAPTVWAAFGAGRIDFARVRDISTTIDALQRAESIARLDARVLAYAVEHTGAELRQWLRRFVQRVEADLAVERAEAARADRHVSVTHGDDSMGWLNAHLPSHELAAIETRLHREARRGVDPHDDRTVAQREADLLAAWCSDPEVAASPIDANIAVTIPADVLAGATVGFADSTDGRWAVPAAWITEAALTGNPFWFRIVLDPVTDDVLSIDYAGRFTPGTLAAALRIRDGVCQARGCLVPAERCDLDHRTPHPDGPTNADNLGALCRKHHNLKSHGLLKWSIGPPPPARALVIEIYPGDAPFEFAA